MSSSSSRPILYLAPSSVKTTVTTTTVTTTTHAPIELPLLPPPSSPKDPKAYPLLYARLPPSLRSFPLTFPGGGRATFADAGFDTYSAQEMAEESGAMSGPSWRMLKRDREDEDDENGKMKGTEHIYTIQDALERYQPTHSKKVVETLETAEPPHMQLDGFSSPPPRKKPRSVPVDIRSVSGSTTTAGPPSPLPSPGGSPSSNAHWASPPPQSGMATPSPPNAQGPMQPDLSLTTLLALPTLVNHFSQLPPALQSHLLLTFLRHSPLPVLRTLHSVLTPTLARDFLTLLPPELTSIVLSYLPFPTLARASRVSRSWRAIIDSDQVLWRELLKSTKIWFGGHSEHAFARTLTHKRARMPTPALPLPHPYKILFKSRHLTRTRWQQSSRPPRRLSFPAHGSSVVTCLLFSHGRIISASDDHSIHVYCPTTGTQLRSLEGHDGGVWALAATKNTLVSGSTDRTVRIWDLETGQCTHVFGGHTSTVRCLAIVKPEKVDIELSGGGIKKEIWPKSTVIVTGSRDHYLRVWRLPKPGEEEYRCYGADEDGDPAEEDTDDNPYHLKLLSGHTHAVRALAAKGRTLISGSYDCSVRVWDIVEGTCKHVLQGHSQKVYSVVLDTVNNQACSGSMDSTVRIWSLETGECRFVLQGHTSLVGLLGLSPSYLVSAAADSTLRVWNPVTGELIHTLQAHTGAITCFQHDEFKVLSGSDGTLKMWDIRDGTVVKDMLTGITGVWQVVFDGRWCVAASNRADQTFLDVWDFGDGMEDDEWMGENESDVSEIEEADDDEGEDDVREYLDAPMDGVDGEDTQMHYPVEDERQYWSTRSQQLDKGFPPEHIQRPGNPPPPPSFRPFMFGPAAASSSQGDLVHPPVQETTPTRRHRPHVRRQR